ncbi:MAG: PAS domain-containing protein [Methylobacterium mesophilicum]|nr:PAS domain-containing protein [Methylobacterium mesophilicum]
MQRDNGSDIEFLGVEALIEAHDWAASSLGPAEGWSDGFRRSLDFCLAAPFPVALWWGADLVQLHNDPFHDAIGPKVHAQSFGQPVARGWREFWPLLAPAVEKLAAGQERSVTLEALPFAGGTGGSSVVAMSLTPLRGGADRMAGIMAACRETVPGEVVDRRRGVLVALDDLLASLDAPETVAARGCELVGLHMGLTSLFLVEVDERSQFQIWPGWPASAFKPDLGRLSDAALEALRGGRPCLLGSAGDSLFVTPILSGGRLTAMLVAEGQNAPRETLGLLSAALKRIDLCQRRARAHERERASARALKATISATPPLLWRSKPRGHWFWSSPRWQEATGLSAEESEGEGWLSAFHPDDHLALRAAWTKAEEGTRLHATARLRLAPDGHYRWFQVDALPVGRGDGEQWFGSCADVDRLWSECEANKTALAAMHHHERSLLALVRAIARRSATESETAGELALRIEGRLEALARIQGVLSRDPQGEVGLDFLVAEELAAHGAYEDGVIQLDGPDVAMRQPAAHAVGLAVHELVAHAIRDGALLHDDGSIHIRWRIESDGKAGELVFSWEEEVEASDGYGRAAEREFTLLEKVLASEIGARMVVEARPRGFVACVSVPVSAEFLSRHAV